MSGARFRTSVTDGYYSEFKGKYVTVVEDNGLLDQNNNPGEFKVKDLREGKYWLKEYQAPNGYMQSGKTYTFDIVDNEQSTISISVDDGKTTGTVLSDNVSITNTPYGGVSWSKVDSTDGMTVLSGSEWKLQD